MNKENWQPCEHCWYAQCEAMQSCLWEEQEADNPAARALQKWKNKKTTAIYVCNGLLSLVAINSQGAKLELASKDDYEKAKRTNSVFEVLQPRQTIQLKEGLWIIDDNFELVQTSR